MDCLIFFIGCDEVGFEVIFEVVSGREKKKFFILLKKFFKDVLGCEL